MQFLKTSFYLSACASLTIKKKKNSYLLTLQEILSLMKNQLYLLYIYHNKSIFFYLSDIKLFRIRLSHFLCKIMISSIQVEHQNIGVIVFM